MNEQLLQQPTAEGKVDGIISTDPWQQQCRECGRVDTKPGDRGVAMWIILAGFRFCLAEGRTAAVRRCPECLAAHTVNCVRCQRH